MVPALILAGGLGTRMRAIAGDVPKPMLPVGGRPFLEFLVKALRRQGVADIVLSLGYRGEAVSDYFGDGSRYGVAIRYVREPTPLGTGGALRLALGDSDREPWLVLNGDSLVLVDLARMLAFHQNKKGRLTVAVVPVSNTARFGCIRVGEHDAVLAFSEKRGTGAGLINAGVYLLGRAVLQAIPEGVVSLERDVFPRFAGAGAYGFAADGPFIDIGVPEDYERLTADPQMLLVAGGF